MTDDEKAKKKRKKVAEQEAEEAEELARELGIKTGGEDGGLGGLEHAIMARQQKRAASGFLEQLEQKYASKPATTKKKARK